MNLDVNFLSEVINGNMGVLCVAMTILSIFYISAEYSKWRHFTLGMRAATAVMIISIGIGMLRLGEYVSWHMYRELYHPSFTEWRIAGGTVAVFGFLAAIAEFSRRLYGNLPWIAAVIWVIVFTSFELITQFHP